MRVLLDERGVQFDGLVAANDNMALAALAELQLRGLKVPSDVAVCGFDDVIEASTSTPPLTTMRQPFQRMGQLALEALVANHNGKSVPPKLFMPTTLQLRRSCGCMSEAVVHVNQGMQMPRHEERVSDPTRSAQADSLLDAHREILYGRNAARHGIARFSCFLRKLPENGLKR